jgi:signal peptidase I
MGENTSGEPGISASGSSGQDEPVVGLPPNAGTPSQTTQPDSPSEASRPRSPSVAAQPDSPSEASRPDRNVDEPPPTFDLRHPFRRTVIDETGTKRRNNASKLELPILIAVAIGIAILLKTFVLQPFYIPSQSMEQTLHGCPGCSGDRILVFKPVYQVRDPHPGDIVVFRAPQDWNEGGGVALSANPLVHSVQWFGQLVGIVPPSEKDLVKRVIAVGGQSVKCCDDQGNVQVSDHGPDGPWRSLTEPYIYDPSPWSKPITPGVKAPDDTRSFGPVTVPHGRLWVMGDHRGDSADSRYHCGDGGTGSSCDPQASTVGVNDVIGKAVVIAWPPSRWRTLGTPQTFAAGGAPGVGAAIVEPVPALAVGVGSVALIRRRRRRRSL